MNNKNGNFSSKIITGLIGVVIALISFFLLPYFSVASERISYGIFGNDNIPGFSLSGYELTQLSKWGASTGFLWLIPIGLVIIFLLLVFNQRVEKKISKILSLISGLVPFIILFFIAMEDGKIRNILSIGSYGLFISLIGMLLGVLSFWGKKNVAENTTEKKNGNASIREVEKNILQMSDISKEATKDAIEVSKSFLADPIGGIYDAYIKLGDDKAKGVGVLFMMISMLFLVLAFNLSLPHPFFSRVLRGFFIFLSLQIVVFVLLLAARKLLSGMGNIISNIYISGLALLPFSLMFFINGLLETQSFWSNYAYLSFGLSYTILVLFSGLTKIDKFSESKSALIIAVILFLLMTTIQWCYYIMLYN